MASPDLSKFVRIVVLFDSPVDGECQAALAAANRALAATGLTWRDIVARLETAGRAAELEQVVELAVAEAVELKQRLAELEQTAGPGWVTTPIAPGAAARIAQWATSLADAAGLTAWECGFLTSLSQWRGAARPKQQQRLEEILERIRDRTGRTPPP